MEQKIYHLYTHSILHCGTGHSVGLVDLPIARNRATHLPLAPGSSVRGVLRDAITNDPAGGADTAKDLFGPLNVSGSSDSYAGALSVGDANLLLLPVRAFQGVLAYTTCPFILKRYNADMNLDLAVPVPNADTALHTDNNKNILNDLIVLEDLDLKTEVDKADKKATGRWADKIAEMIFANSTDAQDDFKRRFLILPDEVFIYLAETAMEIRTRIRINSETGVVQDGALWTEENLPPETVLWGVYAVSDSRKEKSTKEAAELSKHLSKPRLLQLGGNAGIGSGLVQFLPVEAEQ
ncbi:MAG: type III-B CRISPR module RAMP protein Cmr4 [Reinekea sp.]